MSYTNKPFIRGKLFPLFENKFFEIIDSNHTTFRDAFVEICKNQTMKIELKNSIPSQNYRTVIHSIRRLFTEDKDMLTFGIDLRGLVKGVSLSKTEKDRLRCIIDFSVNSLTPQVDPSLYSVSFIPVFDEFSEGWSTPFLKPAIEYCTNDDDDDLIDFSLGETIGPVSNDDSDTDSVFDENILTKQFPNFFLNSFDNSPNENVNHELLICNEIYVVLITRLRDNVSQMERWLHYPIPTINRDLSFEYNEKLELEETRCIEFKQFSFFSLKTVWIAVRYINAYLNSNGGEIWIGITDDGYVCGSYIDEFRSPVSSPSKDVETQIVETFNYFLRNFEPVPSKDCWCIQFFKVKETPLEERRFVVKISVAPVPKVCFVLNEIDGEFSNCSLAYIKRDASVIPMDKELIALRRSEILLSELKYEKKHLNDCGVYQFEECLDDAMNY
eukprot:TRINITY_DN2309_c0_g1_i2.p1 TRINITY_DN2309_c0_g1~~TRINITY_DN2309_c0_g1_i2.p1  ORF type:complete len:442 (+),score=120.90 TRINITY_DN2309_c0_g1_i2:315-1640(+)